MKLLARLGLALACGAATAVIAAIVLAVLDLYLSGNGSQALSRELVSWEPGGVHLSPADLIMLAAALLSAALAWKVLPPAP